jgi:uroporphyrinogen decarboxylase
MTAKQRFLTAMRAGGVPDRVPCTPDISNYIPCKRTRRPFWEIYFENRMPLWKAYLDAADYFGIEAWMASCTFIPLRFDRSRVERTTELVFDKDRDAMIAKTRIRTPDGDMTQQSLCFRADPPSPIEKPIKDLARDFPKYRWLLQEPAGLEMPVVEEMRAACAQRQQAFGLCIGYPGFQGWMGAVEGGVEPLCYAECDTPAILQEWLALDLAYGTRLMELLVAIKPDYLLFGGSGTITLASPELARKYAIPALKKWSAMAKAAGIPTMLHSCGKSRALVDLLCDETDVDCINPLEIAPMGDVDLAEVKRARGRQISLMGNLHTTNVMLKGTPDDVRAAARRAIADAAPGGGFILSSGDQCGRETPEESLFAMVETAHRYGVYDRRTGTLAGEPA